MKAKELKELLEAMPDDADIYFERIKDCYFTKEWWWKTLKIENDMWEWFEDEFIESLWAFKYKWSVFIYSHY